MNQIGQLRLEGVWAQGKVVQNICKTALDDIYIIIMECEWGRPRKIFHFDNMPTLPPNDSQLWEEKWKVIETTVLSFLLNSKNPPSIIHITRALQAVLVRQLF